MKSKFIIILSLVMVLFVLSSVISIASVDFKDVRSTKYEDSVNNLVNLGVINGMPDGSFKPEENLTRAQLLKMLVMALNLEGSDEEINFIDVDEDYWAMEYIKAAVKNKVIAGYPDGTFKPENNVTYAEAVTMIIRAAGMEDIKLKNNSVWPNGHMSLAKSFNIFENISDFSENETVSRGNIAILVDNTIKLIKRLDEPIYELPVEPKPEEEIQKVEDKNEVIIDNEKTADMEKAVDEPIYELPVEPKPEEEIQKVEDKDTELSSTEKISNLVEDNTKNSLVSEKITEIIGSEKVSDIKKGLDEPIYELPVEPKPKEEVM